MVGCRHPRTMGFCTRIHEGEIVAGARSGFFCQEAGADKESPAGLLRFRATKNHILPGSGSQNLDNLPSTARTKH